MITNWPFIYVYSTGRDDGMTHAVGLAPENGPANGSVALFAAKDDAYLFADALAKATGGTAQDSPESGYHAPESGTVENVPADFPVKMLAPGESARDRVTCGACGRSWDDAISTAYTPAPSARCPFEYFH